jgi:hypothetical protein
MAQFHWLHDAIHNQGRTEACAQAQEEHLAALIAPQGLHGGVIYDFNWTAESAFKIKPDPAGGQVMRVRDRPVLDNRARIAH